MATKSKESLDASIIRAFQKHKSAQKLHVTSDGQCFFENNKSFADMHAKRKKFTVTTVDRKDYDIPAEEEAVVESTKAGEPKDYDAMTIPALKDELIAREIAFGKSPKKDALVKLLKDADAANEA